MLRTTTCPYCKDSVSETDAVYCPTCDATHHSECWEANGQRCSVFGCISQEGSIWLGCPWCEEVYFNGRRTCMSCNSPLMTPDECVELLDKYDWVQVELQHESNPHLTAGYLRNNGIVARISKKAPISMFRIGQKISVWVPAEQQETAKNMIDELASRYTYCSKCGHVLFLDEEECSYCLETGTE